jgi:NTE family protein
LRPLEVTGPRGSIRMLDQVDVITGVSGGSFTALAYGLYGERLFDIYERSFLERDVQGELIKRVLSPTHWGDWARAETASELYDEILFHGATYADLDRGDGPFVVVTVTDISTGVRVAFQQGMFDFFCSDLHAVALSRAATASSAVPFAFSPVTLNNYGGTCHHELPAFVRPFTDPATTPRPAARLLTRLRDLQSYEDGDRPFVHLLDRGLSDNLGMRGVLEALEEAEALSVLGRPSPFDDVRRIVVFVVNSRSSPKTNWDQSERPPGAIPLLIKATGVPIDHYSYESVETMRDMVARWQAMRRLRESGAFNPSADPAIRQLLRTPNIDLYVIDVSFAALQDDAEREYLNELPTSFVLPPEAIDRLRAAARKLVRDSPDFQRLLKDARARIVERSSGGTHQPPAAP